MLDKIFNAGVVGAGGAGFPTHVKLNCSVEYFLINAAECEPLLYTDKYIINNHTDEVLSAIDSVSKQINAKETYIAIKAVNTNEIQKLRIALEKYNNIRIYELDNYYPAGDEQMIVYDITKRTVPPGGIPLNVSCVVSNIATMYNVFEALQDIPVTHKFLTVTGEVNRPTVLKVPIGISFDDCIKAAGGARISDYVVINGGPMMGFISGKDEEKFVTKTTSGIIVIPKENNFDSRLHFTNVRQILNRAKSACIQCSFCSDLCPRKLIGHKLRPHMIMRHMASLDFDKELIADDILEEALICCECGVCETYACPMNLSPRQVNKYVKSQLKVKYVNKQDSLNPEKMREYRKIAPSKIMARMGLYDLYNNKVSGFSELSSGTVKIPLKQHIGEAAVPCVALGDSVIKGQLIARAAENKLSANIHASIDGVVSEINNIITIKGGI